MVWKTASRLACAAGLVVAGGALGQPPAATPPSAAPAPVSPYAANAAPAKLPATLPATDTSTHAGKLLDRPLETPPPPADFVAPPEGAGFRYPMDPPLGFTGRSGIVPRDAQGDSDFVPIEDRWRLGM